MAITTYAELKTAVANWLKRDDLTSRIPEFIALAEDRVAMEPKLRIRAMETSTNLTVNAQTVALPTGFLAARRLYISGDPVQQLEPLDTYNFWARYISSTTDKPKAFAVEGENFVFGPSPDSSYTGKLLYYKRFTALSADEDTNWILTNARGLLLYGALLESAPFIKNDTRLLTWATLWDDLVDAVYKQNRKDRHSGGPQTSKTDVFGY